MWNSSGSRSKNGAVALAPFRHPVAGQGGLLGRGGEFRKMLRQFVRQLECVVAAGFRQHQDELVLFGTTDDVGPAQLILEQAGDLHLQLRSGLVRAGLHHDHRHGGVVAPRARDLGFQGEGDAADIEQASDLVGKGLGAQFGLQAAGLAQVQDPARLGAVVQDGAIHPQGERAAVGTGPLAFAAQGEQLRDRAARRGRAAQLAGVQAGQFQQRRVVCQDLALGIEYQQGGGAAGEQRGGGHGGIVLHGV
jgi:hypothetical protein